MSNLTSDCSDTSATDNSNNSNGRSRSRIIGIIGGVALLLMFTGLLISTTILLANKHSTDQAQLRAAEPRTAQVSAASEVPGTTSTPTRASEVTRSNAGIANLTGTELPKSAATATAQRSFDAALQEAAIATQQVTALEQTFKLPDCVSELQELIQTVRVGFAVGSRQPLLQDMAGARHIATIVADCEPVMVAVEGHSDLTGEEQNNMNLSWIRADAVITHLRDEGFDVEALEPLGFGARKPIDPRVTPEANALNRRVQFHLAPRPGTDAALFAEN
ncbi:MAG: OmpA family protein [Tateyamaria sp.]|uniref:OmpA family protein n=1 Tax=Tateyamaria sp. TaxID=1929288 RepID=UPI00329B1CB0